MAGTPQDTFNDLIKDLIKTTDVSEFNGKLLEGLENQTSNFWTYLIQFMYHEYENQYLGHAPIEETDFPQGNESFVEYLNNYIDLDNNTNRSVPWSTIWNDIKQKAINDQNPTWNESLQNIIKGFVDAFDENGRIYIKGSADEPDSVYISINDIMHANAGHKFSGDSDTNDWVLPNINADGKTYGEVRQKDKIISVLNNEEELQFTNPTNTASRYNGFSAWMRLLMPKYLRKVEVEDLNRNFWVLSQTLSAICAFLFGPKAPFAKLFEDMASEVTQLWENVLYLWLAFAMLTQKKEIITIHTEIVYLSNSELESYLKFDNFDTGITIDAAFWNAVKTKCEYLIKQYPNDNLVIVPKVRNNNYKHNYYSKELYPGILYYNRNTNTYSNTTFISNIETVPDNWIAESTGILIDAGSGQHINACMALKEDEFNYTFIPASTILSTPGTYGSDPYYTLIRTNLTSIACNYNTTTHLIEVQGISFDSFDAAAAIYLEATTNALIDSYTIQNGCNEQTSTLQVYHTVERNTPYSKGDTFPYTKTINQGYYQGEIPSWLVPWSISQ